MEIILILILIALIIVIYLFWNNQQQLGKTRQQLDKTREALEESEQLNRQQAEQIQGLEQSHQVQLQTLKNESSAQLSAQEQANIEQRLQLETSHNQAIANLQATHQAAMDQRAQDYQTEIDQQAQSYQADIRQLEEQYQAEIRELRSHSQVSSSAPSTGAIGAIADAPGTTPAVTSASPPLLETMPSPTPASATASASLHQEPDISTNQALTKIQQQFSQWANVSNLPAMVSLKEYSQHPDPQIRELLAQTLGKIGENAGMKASHRQLINLLGLLSKDSSADVRQYAAIALGKIPSGGVIPWLRQARYDTDSDVAKAASQSLDKCKRYWVKTKTTATKKKAKPPQVATE